MTKKRIARLVLVLLIAGGLALNEAHTHTPTECESGRDYPPMAVEMDSKTLQCRIVCLPCAPGAAR